MKLRNVLCMALVLVLLCGCAPAVEPTTTPTTVPTTGPAPTTNPTTTPTTEPVTDPTTTPTTLPSESTEPTGEEVNFAWGYFDRIYVHPFSQAELTNAMNVVNAGLAATADKDEVITFKTHWIAFDPYGTVDAVENQIGNAPVDGWKEADYYSHKMVFVVCFSVDIDQTKSSAADYSNQLGTVTLTRETPDGEWKIDAAACSPEVTCEPSRMVIPAMVLEDLGLSLQVPMAGYHDEPVGQYLLYFLDEHANTVICHSYDAGKTE